MVLLNTANLQQHIWFVLCQLIAWELSKSRSRRIFDAQDSNAEDIIFSCITKCAFQLKSLIRNFDHDGLDIYRCLDIVLSWTYL